MNDAGQGKVERVRGFTVTISSGTQAETENDWSSVSGGGTVLDYSSAVAGGPPKASVTPLVLVGPVTAKRRAMWAWLAEAAAGQDQGRTVTVTPLLVDGGAGLSHVYDDCLIEEYAYPELNSHDHNVAKEQVTIRPERHTIQ